MKPSSPVPGDRNKNNNEEAEAVLKKAQEAVVLSTKEGHSV